MNALIVLPGRCAECHEIVPLGRCSANGVMLVHNCRPTIDAVIQDGHRTVRIYGIVERARPRIDARVSAA